MVRATPRMGDEAERAPTGKAYIACICGNRSVTRKMRMRDAMQLMRLQTLSLPARGV